jgi:hypothetical protein
MEGVFQDLYVADSRWNVSLSRYFNPDMCAVTWSWQRNNPHGYDGK